MWHPIKLIIMQKESQEIWKYIEETNDVYMISNFGRVKSFVEDKQNGYILSIKNSRGWYLSALMKVNGKYKTFRVHRLVAKYFVPNPKNKSEINHIDGNKQNNHHSNLEWVTRHENVLHAMNTGLSNFGPMIKRNRFENPDIIGQYDMDGNFIAAYANSKVASIYTGVCGRNILQVAHKDEYKPGIIRNQAGGFKWKILDNIKDEVKNIEQ